MRTNPNPHPHQVPLACCSDSSSSEDEEDEEGANLHEDDDDDEGSCNADECGVDYSEDAESCAGFAHQDAGDASCNEGGEQGGEQSGEQSGELGGEQGVGSTNGVAARAQSPASRQAAIWRRLKRKHPGSLWAPATQRASPK